MLRVLLIPIVLVASLALAQTEITRVELRSTVRIGAEDTLSIDKLARVSGPQAELLGSVDIDGLLSEPDEHGWRVLDAEQIRETLGEDPRIHAGSVVITGSRCTVRRLAAQDDTPARTGSSAPAASDSPTVADSIQRWLTDRYSVSADKMRYEYKQQDRAFVETPAQGKLIEIREISRTGQTALSVTLYENERIVDEQTITFEVMIEREVAIATQRMRRRDVIDSSMIMRDTQWVGVDSEPIHPDEVIGMSAMRSVNPGQIIERHLLESPIVIERGDIVTAKSIAGGVVVTVRGRALDRAREDETVELESLSGETRFSVRAIGRGRGIVVHQSVLANHQNRGES